MPRPASTRGLPTVSAPALLAHATLGAFLMPAAPFVLGGGVEWGGVGQEEEEEEEEEGPSFAQKTHQTPSRQTGPQSLRESLKIGPGQARQSASWAEAQGTRHCSHARGGFVGGHPEAPQH